MIKMKVNVEGKMIEAEKMSFKLVEDPWCVYRLEDGTLLKIKVMVAEVFRMPTKDPLTGLPNFIVKSTNLMSVDPPDKLSGEEVS